jgi:hypothetical protein
MHTNMIKYQGSGDARGLDNHLLGLTHVHACPKLRFSSESNAKTHVN